MLVFFFKILLKSILLLLSPFTFLLRESALARASLSEQASFLAEDMEGYHVDK